MIDTLYLKPAADLFKTVYPDIKSYLKNLGLNFKAEKLIPDYLQKMLINNHYMESLLFEERKVVFDELYQKQKVKIIGRHQNVNKTFLFDSCKKILASHKSIIIRGSAGLGKSSLARYIIRNSIYEKYKIPFILQLRNYDFNTDIENNLIKSFESLCDIQGVPRDFISTSLTEGKFIIIFDGYDEVKLDKLSEINLLIKNFNLKYGKCPMIILGRPHSNVEIFLNFTLLELCPFSDADVEDYINKVSSQFNKDFITNLKSTIQKTRESHAKEYLKNPLLLSAYILSFKENSSTEPTKISIFYHEVTEALFIKHDKSTKDAFERTLDSGLNKEKLKDFLYHFSLIATSEDAFQFKDEYYEQVFKEINEDNEYSCNFGNLKDDLLKTIAIWIREGIYYKFFHRSLQEYYYAKGVSFLSKEIKKEHLESLIEYNPKFTSSDYSLRLQLLEEIDMKDTIDYLLLPMTKDLIDKLSDSKSNVINFYIDEVWKSNSVIFKKEKQFGNMITAEMRVHHNSRKSIIQNILRKIDMTLFEELDKKIQSETDQYIRQTGFTTVHTKNIRDIVKPEETYDLIMKFYPLLNQYKEDLEQKSATNKFDKSFRRFKK